MQFNKKQSQILNDIIIARRDIRGNKLLDSPELETIKWNKKMNIKTTVSYI